MRNLGWIDERVFDARSMSGDVYGFCGAEQHGIRYGRVGVGKLESLYCLVMMFGQCILLTGMAGKAFGIDG